MSVKWTTSLGLLLTVIAGCSAQSGPGDYALASAGNSTITTKSPEPDETPSGETKTARRVIREDELRFETTNRNATRTEILGFVQAHRGNIEN